MNEIDFKKFCFRRYRDVRFKAFDLWEKAVIRGREVEDESIMKWFQEMRDFTDSITEDTTPNDYPQMPELLNKYL